MENNNDKLSNKGVLVEYGLSAITLAAIGATVWGMVEHNTSTAVAGFAVAMGSVILREMHAGRLENPEN